MGKILGGMVSVGALLLASAAPAQSPQVPAKTMSEAAPAPAPVRQDYSPKPALWLLSDADTKIYLFGTIHMLPPGFRWRTAAFDRVVGQADELIVETYEAPGAEMGDKGEVFARYFISPKPSPIAGRVPAEHRAALSRALADLEDMPVQAFDLMQTWAVAFMLGIDQVFEGMGAEDPSQAPGVEDQLEEVFRGAEKPIGSIEDGDAVIGQFFGLMSKLPEAEQAEFLVDAVKADRANGGEEEDLEDVHDWARGHAEKLDLESEEEPLPEEIYDMLVVRRNQAWTGWLSDRLAKPGTVLVAVGAGHLAGKDSVQRMLAARGMPVTRVQ